ncbi:hypothetical protein RJ639_028048 [Escallonia herrerae]|uniref:Uncharacterized protein n=1 Tax=Escallonia herrerae TaxID=1293975 RepID=A0AA89BPS6_9ASTE|nr:hypothetical protein RJ639_028048 [Escallonia herrerae]
MENKELMMNIVALGILVITAIVNICIQLGTGVIYVFWKEHAVVMFLMLVLLAILTSSALAVPTTKCYLELKYSKKHKLALKECWDRTDLTVIDRLREGLTKYWMMAYTCSPKFVMGRSATCTASGAFCLLSAVTLVEAMLRSYLMPWSFKFCRGDSDYKWSTTLVLLTQTIAVGVGTIAPAFRWFTAMNFRKLKWLIKCNNAISTDDSVSESQRSWELDLSRFVMHLEGEEELGVSEFDSDEVASLDSEGPPNSWALPVVTLATIAVALPNIDNHLIEQLKEQCTSGPQDVDLRKIALQEKSPKEILEELADTAKNTVMEFRKTELAGCLRDIPTRWPGKILAANSMYSVCRTILLDYHSRDCESCDRLFERFTIEEREESVRHAILLLGRTEEMLKIIDGQSLPCSDPDQRAHIDHWRLLSKKKDSSLLESASADGDGASFSSPDLYISID